MTIIQYCNLPFANWQRWNEVSIPEKGLFEVQFTQCWEPVIRDDEPPVLFDMRHEETAVEKFNLLVTAIQTAVNNKVYMKIYADWYLIESDILETYE